MQRTYSTVNAAACSHSFLVYFSCHVAHLRGLQQTMNSALSLHVHRVMIFMIIKMNISPCASSKFTVKDFSEI